MFTTTTITTSINMGGGMTLFEVMIISTQKVSPLPPYTLSQMSAHCRVCVLRMFNQKKLLVILNQSW